MGRYSHSKIDTFKTCPKKYDYNYVQELEPIEDSINLIVGKLYHAAIEAVLKGEDPVPFYDEFDGLVLRNMLRHCRRGTLERVVNHYFTYYEDIDRDNEILFVEKKFEHLTDDADVISGVIDVVYRRHGFVFVKDHKTTVNALKYTQLDVKLNRQLNVYSLVLEKDFSLINTYMEIDEVCIRELDEVTLNKDGTPTVDQKKLAWVTYEDYLETLIDLDLDADPKYYGILKYLKERGHPLFRRITVPVEEITRDNIYKEQISIIKSIETIEPYRVKSKLCDFCPFQELCNLELQGTNDVLVEHIRKSRYKPKIEDGVIEDE